MLVTKQVQFPLTSIIFFDMGTKTVWLPTFFRIYYFMFHRTNIFIHLERYQSETIMTEFYLFNKDVSFDTLIKHKHYVQIINSIKFNYKFN